MRLFVFCFMLIYFAFCLGAKVSKYLDEEIEKQDRINKILDDEIRRLKAKAGGK